MTDFLKTVSNRRSFYAINDQSPLSETEITALIETAVKYCPSAFNSQSGRVIILFGREHRRLWNIVEEALQKVTPPERFPATKEKIQAFRNGYGSVLYFEDQETVTGLQQKFPLYQDKFPLWSEQSNGMLQFIVWTALENRGLGASLQHYNPLIDQAVQQTWKLPESWKLIAQMPFGGIVQKPEPKTFLPLETRVKVFA